MSDYKKKKKFFLMKNYSSAIFSKQTWAGSPQDSAISPLENCVEVAQWAAKAWGYPSGLDLSAP